MARKPRTALDQQTLLRSKRPGDGDPMQAHWDELNALPKEGKERIRMLAQRAMKRRTAKYEQDNPDRYRTAQSILGLPESYPNRYLSEAMGWDKEGGAEPTVNPTQGTLFDRDDMLSTSPRWEELHPSRQARILSAAADYGVTPESMRRAFTAQLQRGLLRDPNHLSFYEATGHSANGDELPRERMTRSSEEMGVPFPVTAATNAITSPQMPFVTHTSKGTQYPNAEVAEKSIEWSLSGQTGQQYITAHAGGRYPNQGYPSNFALASDVAHDMLGGMPVNEAWSPGGGPGRGSGDKVRAYYNAWIDPRSPEGNFFVSDTHSGGAGMAPHLAGTPLESKYLSIAGIHALHDHVARQVMAEHGLTSVSRTQSLQWNQEKIEATNGTTAASAAQNGQGSVAAMTPAANPAQTRQGVFQTAAHAHQDSLF